MSQDILAPTIQQDVIYVTWRTYFSPNICQSKTASSLYTCSCSKQCRVFYAHMQKQIFHSSWRRFHSLQSISDITFLTKALKRIFFLICLPLTTFKINKKRKGQAKEELLHFFAPESFRIIFRISVYSHNTPSPCTSIVLQIVWQRSSVPTRHFHLFDVLPHLRGIARGRFAESSGCGYHSNSNRSARPPRSHYGCFYISLLFFFLQSFLSAWTYFYLRCLKAAWCKSVPQSMEKTGRDSSRLSRDQDRLFFNNC